MAAHVRIGIIGAGAFTTSRMLPNFQKIPDVTVTAVANRRRESADQVASTFGIATVYDDWRDLLASPEVDAVLIGSPPSLHKETTFAALDAGKHVLCQTRIAMTADEARAMHAHAERARARGVRSMLVPPAPFYRGSRYIGHLVQSGALGRLTHVQAFNMNASFADPKAPLSTGRRVPDLYGPYNAGQLGLTYDVVVPWTGHATSVVAQRALFTPERPLTPDGPLAKSPYPDEVTVIAETESGAVAMVLLNNAAHFATSRIELYGSDGTAVSFLRGDLIMTARAGDAQLQQVPIPAEYDNPWLVEEEFVRLVRGEVAEPSFTFWDGVKGMEYLEAAYTSATEGRRVELPQDTA